MTRGTIALLVSAGVMLGLMGAPSACVIPSIGSNSDAGSSATSSSDAGAALTPAATGASCTAISSTISLCQYISICPSLTLNTQVFPQCGFRIHGAAIDPECLCDNEYLCPIASPTTCAEAATETTGDVNYDSVCQKYLTGGCTDSAAPASSSSSSGSSSGSVQSACQACVSACNNVPTCIEACNC